MPPTTFYGNRKQPLKLWSDWVVWGCKVPPFPHQKVDRPTLAANHPHMRVQVWLATSIPTDFRCFWRKRSDFPHPTGQHSTHLNGPYCWFASFHQNLHLVLYIYISVGSAGGEVAGDMPSKKPWHSLTNGSGSRFEGLDFIHVQNHGTFEKMIFSWPKHVLPPPGCK